MRRRIAGGVALAAVAAGGVVVATGGETPVKAAAQGPARATASVERTDLVDRATVGGTLGYADPGTRGGGGGRARAALRDPGAVIGRGHSLYSVDDAPAAFLFYGTLP